MATRAEFPLQVFYDGRCAICSREMQLLQRRECAGRLVFFDISAPDFMAAEQGRSKADFMKELHVRDGAGRFHTGVSAFARIWSAFPESLLSRLLERILALPGIHQCAAIGYATCPQDQLPRRELSIALKRMLVAAEGPMSPLRQEI